MNHTISAPLQSAGTGPSLETSASRSPEAPVHPQFVERWSSRAFSTEAIAPEILAGLFEAARWAPSASNAQPWLFVYADQPHDLERFRPLIKENNRRWADQAPVLVFLFARRQNRGAPNRTAQFDSGAAWMSLALEASRHGLITRAMGGILADQVYEALAVPREEYEVVCGIALGKRGRREDLHEDFHEREKPSPRRPLNEVALRGRYSSPTTP